MRTRRGLMVALAGVLVVPQAARAHGHTELAPTSWSSASTTSRPTRASRTGLTSSSPTAALAGLGLATLVFAGVQAILAAQGPTRVGSPSPVLGLALSRTGILLLARLVLASALA